MISVNKKVIDVIYNGFWHGLPVIVGNRKDIEEVQQWMVEINGNLYSNAFNKNKTNWEENINKSMLKIMEGGQDGNALPR